MILPFGGGDDELEEARSRIAAIALAPGDEAILVDNRVAPGPERSPEEGGGVRIVPAAGERSSYYARNVGAAAAQGEWLLFIDADCVPPADLIDRYFEPAPDPGCGLVAGTVAADPGQASLSARYSASRGHIDAGWHFDRKPLPAGVTANLLVLRAAWDSLGGFHEGIRSGGDVELCWRIQEAGWSFEHRAAAAVRHRHPERLRAMWRKTARHAAGRVWVGRRYAAAYERPRPERMIPRSLAGAVVRTLQGRPREGLYKLIDATWHLADAWGWTCGDNRAAPGPRPGGDEARAERPADVLYITDAAPARSETFIFSEARAMEERGWRIRFEASSRAARSDRGLARTLPIRYLEDDSPIAKLRALAVLSLRSPVRVWRDRALRRRLEAEEDPWPLAALAPAALRLRASGEQHIHIHFGALAAGHGLRLAALAGIGYSVVWHGYDVHQKPRNRELKLELARFSTADCESFRRDLAALVAPEVAARIAVVPMGVDPDLFEPPAADSGDSGDSGERVVIGVGRLVPKKGFEYLIRAAAVLRDRAAVDRVTIIGAGPERPRLDAEIASLGLGDVVEITEAWGPGQVREQLEQATVMAAPYVIAPDGDRDSMPVVIKEALAMELPVVASDEVGIPEMIEPGWGRLVPPGDPDALAAALEELLRLDADELRGMGRAGREFVSRELSLEACAVRLEALLEDAGVRASARAGAPPPVRR